MIGTCGKCRKPTQLDEERCCENCGACVDDADDFFDEAEDDQRAHDAARGAGISRYGGAEGFSQGNAQPWF